MKKVIVFDMDDTLYDEYTYVKSGFNAVAQFLSLKLDVPQKTLFNEMWQQLEQSGRGAIFDDVLKRYDRFTKTLAQKCVTVYRTHEPNIELPKESIRCLHMIKSFPLYLVTDGNKIAQHNKVKALGLYDKMKHCYITHRYGIKHAKPSPYCFLHIQKRENVAPENIVYIGDNIRKDFVGIKPLGFRTIRVLAGEYRNIKMPDEYEAELKIDSLAELPQALMTLWPNIKLEEVSL